jgi:putative transposase
MKGHITSTSLPASAMKVKALATMSASFERFCLAAGVEALTEMMEQDAQAACGPRHGRANGRRAHRWGKTKGKIGFHGGRVDVERPRLRGFDGKEQVLPSWEAVQSQDWLGAWAMNKMLINVSTRKFGRSMRLPEGDVPASAGSGLSKSAASRRFVALSAARLKEWMGSDLFGLDLLAIQIDGIHMDEDMTLVGAVGIDGDGGKHPLGVVEGATENAATVQALIDNLIERGLDPGVPRLFIVDGSKALSKATRRTFGRAGFIQRCQIHKARNIMERLPKTVHAQVRRALRQAWEMDDPVKAERLLRNLARRLEQDWRGVAASILEGLDEMLTVTRLGLPRELRRSLACTNIVENMMGTVRRVTRNVKYWRSPSMALRWAGAAMQETAKGFRKLKAHKQLPFLWPYVAATSELDRALAATQYVHELFWTARTSCLNIFCCRRQLDRSAWARSCGCPSVAPRTSSRACGGRRRTASLFVRAAVARLATTAPEARARVGDATRAGPISQ